MTQIRVDHECACKFGFLTIEASNDDDAIIEAYKELKEKQCNKTFSGRDCKPKLSIDNEQDKNARH